MIINIGIVDYFLTYEPGYKFRLAANIPAAKSSQISAKVHPYYYFRPQRIVIGLQIKIIAHEYQFSADSKLPFTEFLRPINFPTARFN